MKRITVALLAVFVVSNSYSQADTSFNIWMWTTGLHQLHDGLTIKNYGFTLGAGRPSIPGPTLRVKQGQKVRLNVRNQSQGAPHTIHLHGLDVDQANDGVPATSFVIPHKETKQYEFVATHAGTYLYHCHVASVLHVQLGMYGSFIVEPKDREAAPGYFYGRDFNLLMSEADKSWFDNKPKHSTGDSVHAKFNLPVYEPDYFFVNGQSQQQIDTLMARSDENVFIRLSNVGYFENLVQFPAGLTATLITSDGRPLPTKKTIDSLYLTPGERYGVMLSPLGSAQRSIKINYLHMFTGKQVHAEEVVFGIDETLPAEATAQQTSIRTYPNPVLDVLTIENSFVQPVEFAITSMLGRTVLQGSIESSKQVIDINHLKSGTYVLKVGTISSSIVKK